MRPGAPAGPLKSSCLARTGAVRDAASMPTDRSSITPRRYALQSLFGPGQDGMVSHTPHAAHLGIRVVETGPGFGVCALPFREELIGDPRRRVIFGGAITTLIDHVSGLAVACAVEELTAIATIDLRVDYLRAAEPDWELYARSDCYRLTRNGAFLELTALLRLLDENGSGPVPKPITFSVDYLRSAGPSATRAGAEIFKLGRRIANVRVVAWQDDRSRPVVAGNGKFLMS